MRLTDFGTAKVMHSSQRSHSSNSGISDMSCTSGMSNISAISGISNNNLSCPSTHSNERVGQSQHNGEEAGDELVGSEHFISPEMLESRQTNYASDIWALGVILY